MAPIRRYQLISHQLNRPFCTGSKNSWKKVRSKGTPVSLNDMPGSTLNYPVNQE